jgi:hypothetical protein
MRRRALRCRSSSWTLSSAIHTGTSLCFAGEAGHAGVSTLERLKFCCDHCSVLPAIVERECCCFWFMYAKYSTDLAGECVMCDGGTLSMNNDLLLPTAASQMDIEGLVMTVNKR